MRTHIACLVSGIILAGTLTSSPASAAPIDFDCDVPADHYSSVSQDVSVPATVEGQVELVQARSGTNLPVAGVRFVSADGADSVGFRLVASSAHAKQLQIRLNIKQGSALKEEIEGLVDAKAKLTFAFSLSASGKASLVIGQSSFSAEFLPISEGKVMAFCSTAQFKFTNLRFPVAPPAEAITTR